MSASKLLFLHGMHVCGDLAGYLCDISSGAPQQDVPAQRIVPACPGGSSMPSRSSLCQHASCSMHKSNPKSVFPQGLTGPCKPNLFNSRQSNRPEAVASLSAWVKQPLPPRVLARHARISAVSELAASRAHRCSGGDETCSGPLLQCFGGNANRLSQTFTLLLSSPPSLVFL